MSNEATKFCQSCGMPLTKDEELGTNKDGSRNEEYCTYCYQDGAFTGSQTMEEMVDLCLEYGAESGMYTDREQAKKEMLAWFPTLKRWQKA